MISAVLPIACLLVFFGMQTFTAAADCALIGKEAKGADALLSVAMDQYTRVAGSVPKANPTPDQVSKAISASTKLIDAITTSIQNLERGEAENCFGKQAANWKQILRDLKVKLGEFSEEREALLRIAASLNVKQLTTVPKSEWKLYLAPSMKAFAICVVQTKRRALALDGKKPSPQDFALIMNGACNAEASVIEADQEKIQGWTSDDRRELQQGLNALRARAISEYTEAFHGERRNGR